MPLIAFMHSFPAVKRAKKTGPSLAFACVVSAAAALAACTNLGSKPPAVNPMPQPAAGLHVLELFTSEGCSSCPAADRLLSKLNAEGDSTVFVLSYHVDYWDHLGWKDPFGQAAFSNRQREYARRFSLESSYTPQVVVNGEEEFVGSDETRLRASVAKKENGSVGVTASALLTDKNNLRLSYSLSSAEGMTLNVALVQDEATSEVKRGENGGRTLQHVNVVRELNTVQAQSAGRVDVLLPQELKGTRLSLVVFTQQKAGGKITGAARVAVPLQKGA